MKIKIDRLNPEIYTSGTGLQIQTILGIFSAFAQTLLSTSLILYRIITITRRTNMPKQTYNTYKNIVDLVVQSSAVYSVVLLIWAISWVITPASTDGLRRIPAANLTKFIEEITFIVAVRFSRVLYQFNAE